MERLYIVHPNVHLGAGCQIGEYVIIGVPPADATPGSLATHIGSGAMIRSHSVIYAGSRIGTGFTTGHGVMIRERNEVGNDVSVGTHSVIEHHVHIEHRVRIHANVFIPEYSVLEEGAWVGPNVVFTNARYPLSPGAKRSLRGPRLLPGAKIGANATLLPGITIGRNALVGAGAVVVRDVPDDTVVAGSPARPLDGAKARAAYAVHGLVV